MSTYVLTDNEKSVTIEHIAGIPGRNQQLVRLPMDTNLLEECASFAELETACEAFCEKVNTRAHRLTKRPPIQMLARNGSGCIGSLGSDLDRLRNHAGGAAQHADGDVRVRLVLGSTQARRARRADGCSLIDQPEWVRTHGSGTVSRS